MTREKEGVKISIWDGYNPKLYVKELVNREEAERYADRDLYPRRLIRDTNGYTKLKGVWINTQDFFKSLVI